MWPDHGSLLVLGAADEQQLGPLVLAVAQDERHGGAPPARLRPAARACAASAAVSASQPGAVTARTSTPGSASSARAWVSQRKAMLGDSSPRRSSASTSAGDA